MNAQDATSTATVNGKTQIEGILDAWQSFFAERVS